MGDGSPSVGLRASSICVYGHQRHGLSPLFRLLVYLSSSATKAEKCPQWPDCQRDLPADLWQFIYTALPLDTAVIALGLAMLVLMVFYARPLGGKGKALRDIPLLRKLTPALLLGGLTLVPALAPDAPHPLWGMALATSVFVIATGFSLLRPQTLPLTSHAQ
jgi:hypothetical protein